MRRYTLYFIIFLFVSIGGITYATISSSQTDFKNAIAPSNTIRTSIPTLLGNQISLEDIGRITNYSTIGGVSAIVNTVVNIGANAATSMITGSTDSMTQIDRHISIQQESSIIRNMSGSDSPGRNIVMNAMQTGRIVQKDIEILTPNEKRIVDIISKNGDFTSSTNIRDYIRDRGITTHELSEERLNMIRDRVIKSVESRQGIGYITSDLVGGGGNMSQYVQNKSLSGITQNMTNQYKSSGRTTKSLLVGEINTRFLDIKKEYDLLSIMEDNLEKLGYINGCEPGKDVNEIGGYKYAKDSNSRYTIPCSKRKFNEYSNAKKRELMQSLYDNYTTFYNEYNNLWNRTMLESAAKANANIDENGVVNCVSGSNAIGFGCVDLDATKVGGTAYGGDAGAVILDPFNCNSLSTPAAVRDCKSRTSNNSFRLVPGADGKIGLQGIIYSLDCGPIMFGIPSLPTTIDTIVGAGARD